MKKPIKGADTAPQHQAQKRIYKNEVEFNHDCFKLLVSSMKVNVSWNDKPEYITHEHVHMFHTFDSDGRRQTKSTSSSGHFHPIIVHDNGEGNLPDIEIGPAMQEIYEKKKGEVKKVSKPLDEEFQHTHDKQWITSELLKGRVVNVEALKTQQKIVDHQTQASAFTAEERKTIVSAIDRDRAAD